MSVRMERNSNSEHKGIFISVLFMLFISLGLMLCANSTQAAEDKEELLMATTTSTDNTGLLDYLMPAFTAQTGIDIRWTATGTGKALKLGENCDVDVLLVHAPQAEIDFVKKGFGKDRRQIMYNDFVLIGPPGDPASIQGKKVRQAMKALRSSNSIFVSRGDNSGTNKKEKTLWKRKPGTDRVAKACWRL
jgi:tungstate transport system substrate-binding protein